MTAGCITFEELESRTESSVALAIHARHVKDSVFAYTLGYFLLSFLASKVSDLRDRLKTPNLEKCNDEQLTELAELLKQLARWLSKLTDDAATVGLRNFIVLRKPLKRIEECADDFESIVENIYLAINPEFHTVATSAIDKLSAGAEDCATMLR